MGTQHYKNINAVHFMLLFEFFTKVIAWIMGNLFVERKSLNSSWLWVFSGDQEEHFSSSSISSGCVKGKPKRSIERVSALWKRQPDVSLKGSLFLLSMLDRECHERDNTHMEWITGKATEESIDEFKRHLDLFLEKGNWWLLWESRRFVLAGLGIFFFCTLFTILIYHYILHIFKSLF